MGFLTEATLPVGSGVFNFNTPYEISWCSLDSTHLLFCYNQKNPNYFIGQVVELNGNSQPILHTPTLIESVLYDKNSVISLSPTTVLLYVNKTFKILTINPDWSITPGNTSIEFDNNVLTPTAKYYHVISPTKVIFGYDYSFTISHNGFSGSGIGIKWISINIDGSNNITFSPINDTPLLAEISNGTTTGYPVVGIGGMPDGSYFIISASDMQRPYVYNSGNGAWFGNIYNSSGSITATIAQTPTITLTQTKKVIALSTTKLIFVFDKSFVIYNITTSTWSELVEFATYNNRIANFQDVIRLDDNHIMAISNDSFTRIYVIRNNYDILGVVSPNTKFGLLINDNSTIKDVSSFDNRLHIIDNNNIAVIFRTHDQNNDTYNIAIKILYQPS